MKFILLLILIFPLHAIGQSVEENSLKEFTSGQTQKYSTNGLGKSQGLKLNLKFPKSWHSLDGERPNVVKKFIQPEDNTFAIILIFKKDKPLSALEINDEFSIENLRSVVTSDGTFITANNKLEIEGLRAANVEFTLYKKRVDNYLFSHDLFYSFIYQEYFVSIQFMV